MFSGFASSLPNAVVTLVLIAGVVDDLRSRKVHNWLVLGGAAVVISAMFAHAGVHALVPALLSFGACLALMMPLVLLKIMGAGDMKILAAVSFALSWQTVMYLIFYSLIWGAVLGIVQILLSKQGRHFIQNMRQLVALRQTSGIELHKIPFTVALLMGWLTCLSTGLQTSGGL